MTLGVASSIGAWVVLHPTFTCLPRAPVPRGHVPVTPDAGAVRFIRTADLQGKILMYFDWGLYAIWHVGDRMKVSIDNRRETVYSDEVVKSHGRLYDGLDPDYAMRITADYVWLPVGLAPVDQLQRRGWFLIYRDARSALLSRTFLPLVVGAAAETPACFPEP